MISPGAVFSRENSLPRPILTDILSASKPGVSPAVDTQQNKIATLGAWQRRVDKIKKTTQRDEVDATRTGARYGGGKVMCFRNTNGHYRARRAVCARNCDKCDAKTAVPTDSRLANLSLRCFTTTTTTTTTTTSSSTVTIS
ncbi:hypothetical protein PLESTM_000156100 [Pleodorina starrii]|nr:hypothetical protein PLESTM_000156100 [Pleodorina starrii]